MRDEEALLNGVVSALPSCCFLTLTYTVYCTATQPNQHRLLNKFHLSSKKFCPPPPAVQSNSWLKKCLLSMYSTVWCKTWTSTWCVGISIPTKLPLCIPPLPVGYSHGAAHMHACLARFVQMSTQTRRIQTVP